MKNLLNSRSLPLLFILGLGLTVLACGRMYISQQASFLNLGVTILGLAILGISFWSFKSTIQKHHDPIDSKKLLRSFLKAAVLILSIILINTLAYKTNIRFDATAAKQHTLTKATKTILKNLKQNIKITAFYVGVPPKYLEDLLAEYSKSSNGKVTVEIIDPLLQIGLAAQFSNTINTEEKKIVVQTDTGRKDIPFTEKPLTEEPITNAIVNLTQKAKTIYFLAGHGEFALDEPGDQGLSKLRKHFLKNNFLTKSLLLKKEEEIPLNCDILVIAGPKTLLEPKEEKAIQKYLRNGGRALILVEATPMGTQEIPLTEADKLKNPSLNTILDEWGITVEDDLVVDMENFVGTDIGCPATKNYPPFQEVIVGLDYSFYVRPRSITIHEKTPPMLQILPLILTSSPKNSWAEKDRSLFIKYTEGIDTKGPVPIGMAIRDLSKSKDQKDTRIIVLTDADFVSNQFIDHYANSGVLLNATKWLAESNYVILEKDKRIQVEYLDLTSQQVRTIAVILFILPLLIAVIGIGVWYRHFSS